MLVLACQACEVHFLLSCRRYMLVRLFCLHFVVRCVPFSQNILTD